MEEIERIKEDVQLVKGEVDALQIAVLSSRTTWYKNIPIIISILALAFSFGTTYVSNERTEVQDIQNLKSDLRNMLQRLADLPSRNFELTRKYADDPQAIGYFSGQLNQENSLLAAQAAELYSIAVALQFSYQNEKAKEFYQLSYDLADNMNIAISAKRGSANVLFISGQAEAGRVQFQQALNIFSVYKGYNDSTQKNTHIITLLNWAGAEAGMGFVDSAIQKIEEAENIANSMVPGSLTNQLIGQIRQARSQISGITK